MNKASVAILRACEPCIERASEIFERTAGGSPVSNATSTGGVSGHDQHLGSIDFCCESARRCRPHRRSQSEGAREMTWRFR